MTWSAPATALANTILTAAFWNAEVRDHLLETAPAKASTAGQLFQATAANAIAALNAVAYRMPRGNAAGNLMEYVASLNLAQAPVYAAAATVNLAAIPTWANVLNQSFTTHGGLVIAITTAQSRESLSAETLCNHRYSLWRDATQIGQTREAAAESLSVAYFNGTVMAVETPAAATYTYHVAGMYQNNATSGTPNADAQLLLVELAP